MKHYPIFLDLTDQTVVLAGGGAAALAKLRLLLKTDARIVVVAEQPADEIVEWAADARLVLHRRALRDHDLETAVLIYAAAEDDLTDARTARIARRAGVLVNVVDNLTASQFITPAIVDRSPVTVAIGTEGAAPVLARIIKADLEERLPAALGRLATAARAFRRDAETLPKGAPRRAFWRDVFFGSEATLTEADSVGSLKARLHGLLQRHKQETPAQPAITFVTAPFDDAELLTLKARKALDAADVVLHDATTAPELLELARREADFVALSERDDLRAALTGLIKPGQSGLRLSAEPPKPETIRMCEGMGLRCCIIPGLLDLPPEPDLRELA